MIEASRRGALAFLAAGIAACATKQGPELQPSQLPLDEAAIRGLLAQFVDREHHSLGVVVGVVTPRARQVIAHGVFGKADPRPVDGQTVFGIASVTKTFTGLLLAEAVRRNEVKLDDPVAAYLPKDATLPVRGGRQITLVDLATHTAGMPLDPDRASLAGDDPANPMAPVYATLRDYRLPTDIGAAWSYSNLGFSLLGEALSRRAGLSYEELVRRRVLSPLGMSSTGIALTPGMAARRAPGHNELLEPMPDDRRPWTWPSGGLSSTIEDLMLYATAFARLSRSPLAPAMAATRAVLRPTPAGYDGEYGFGWLVMSAGGRPVVAHLGVGKGYASCVAFDPAARTAVVVLSNAQPEVMSLGLRCLRPGLSLAATPSGPSSPDLDRFPGIYELDADLPTQRLVKGARITIARRDAVLVLTIPGLPPGPLARSDETHFTINGFPVAVEFHLAPGGPANTLVLTIAKVSATATRLL